MTGSIFSMLSGLVQRERRIQEYEDLDARFDRRPSVWVEAVGDWGAGRVDLIEIPSTRETNDNIVAFWRPETPILKGGPWTLAYRMHWSGKPSFNDDLAEVMATRSGWIADRERREFVVDFDLGPLQAVEGIVLDVTSNVGKIAKSRLRSTPEFNLMRASFELAPEDQTLIELRAVLSAGDQRPSETWLYRWTLVDLVLSIPLSKLSGSTAAGSVLARLRLLRIPENIRPPDVLTRRNELIVSADPLPKDGLLTLVQSRTAREQHERALLPHPPERRGAPKADRLTAAAKIADAETRDEALS